MSEKQVIIVDGANVAFESATKQGKPRVSNITALISVLEEEGFRPIVIVDASLRHKIDDPDHLESLIEKQTVLQSPAGTEADYFVLEVAGEHGAQVVSNDTYKEYREQYPWIQERRIPFMVVEGAIQLYEKKLETPGD
jgi:replication-associated recombination protein RarA